MKLTVWLATVPLILGAINADLEGLVEASSQTDYAGEQLVSCHTPDGDRTSVFQVAQVDGTVVAWTEGESESVVTVSPGRTVTVTGDEIAVSVVESGGGAADVASYELGTEREVTFLGRSAIEVPLVRDGVQRAVLTVDSATGAIVQTVSLDASGAPYCERRLLSFQTEGIRTPPVSIGQEVDSATPIESAPPAVVDANNGFQLLDTYAIEQGTMSYFTDGFFTAGVVVTQRPISLPAEAVTVQAESGIYLREYEAGTVTVTWKAGDSNYAVIGDLPPDLLEDFIAGLPAPTDSGFLGRLWERLFG